MCDFILDCKTEAGFLQNTKSCNLFTFPAFKILSIRFYDICGHRAQHKEVSSLLIIFSSVLY